jgi:hypothetical protein
MGTYHFVNLFFCCCKMVIVQLNYATAVRHITLWKWRVGIWRIWLLQYLGRNMPRYHLRRLLLALPILERLARIIKLILEVLYGWEFFYL